jgi:hypothetical protein
MGRPRNWPSLTKSAMPLAKAEEWKDLTRKLARLVY